ncbi:MAG: hypothetical protein CLLPBCKN_007298 [Chroococcidiopsis cubana SAG 39.79]|uniref:hypothetical protein n=1 Tax=Chroococcidiopsis cubana TaxID=171392 RepID=UPI00131519EE|nr:hypothetical protein [Chroococcidiopsis cubana]MDZ4877863.1 hypothetical protein [Chroococcidiopsis cubana SAG 39.79]
MRAATIYQKLQVSQYLKLLPYIHLRSLAIEMQFEYNALYLALAAFMPAKLVTADLRL